MQHLNLGPSGLAAYHAHLQRDHDFTVWAEVLTMEQVLVNTVDLLDGQVNFTANASEGPDRTASCTLSDPEGALSFTSDFAQDDTGMLWVNRMLRLRHRVVVPSLGPITTTAMIGVPTSAARSGGEIELELADKSLLADHGVRPKTYPKGANVRDVIVSLLRDLCGERYLRIPVTSKKLSVPYTVGMGENILTPWRLAKHIAGREMGWRLYYSGDGYATAEPSSVTTPLIVVNDVLKLPESSTSFTDFSNYAKTTSNRKMKNTTGKGKEKKTREWTTIFEGVAVLPADHPLSEQSLARNGAPRTLPVVVTDDDLKNQAEVNARTIAELQADSSLSTAPSYEIMPMFHLDQGDRLSLPEGIGAVSFDRASVPLGVGGNMTLGRVQWVSRAVKVRRAASKRTIIRKKKEKGGKKNG